MRKTLTAAVAALTLLGPVGALAQSAAPGGIVIQQLTAEQLMGRHVIDVEGQGIGEVADLILNDDGEVARILVSTGGFLGLGERVVAFEPDQVLLGDGEAGDLVTKLTREQIEALPAFEKTDEGWHVID